MKKIKTTSIQKTAIIEVIPVTKEFVFNLLEAKAHTEALPEWTDCKPVVEFFDEIYYAVFPEDKPKEAKPEEEQTEQEKSDNE